MELLTFTSDLLGANMYVLKFGDEAIVIDPCVSIFDAHLDGATVKSVLFTHGHFDHISYADEYAEKYNCLMLISPEDKEMLTDSCKNLADNMGMRIEICAQIDSFCKEEYSSSDLGFASEGLFTLKVISTPGHSSGSVCLLFSFADGSYPPIMFTGDTLFAGSIGRTDLSGNVFEMQNSLKMISQMADDIICYPGHGEKTSIGFEKQHNPYL